MPTTADNEKAHALAVAQATPRALVVRPALVGRGSSGLRTPPSIAHGFDAHAPVMQVLALRVAWLLRRYWRATLAFALAAGLAGGLSMAAWGVGAPHPARVREGSPGLGAVLSPDRAGGHVRGRALRAGGQPAVRNLERLRLVPWLLAAIVVVLAAGSLAHALVLLTGRQRGALVVVPAVVGAVCGALVARIGWRAVVDRLGVVSPAVVPPFALALVVLGAVVFANLVAIWPGRRAAAIRPSEALRSE